MEDSRLQSLSETAKMQTQAGRYLLLRQINKKKIIQEVIRKSSAS